MASATAAPTAAPTAPPSNRTSLLDLPRELRDIIWTMAPTSDRSSSNNILVIKGQFRLPTVLHTVSQIRREALSIFYSKFDFSVGKVACEAWLGTFLPPVPACKIRVEILCNNPGMEKKKRMLREAEAVLYKMDVAVEVNFVAYVLGQHGPRYRTLAELERLGFGAYD